jgi:hypothetical protein
MGKQSVNLPQKLRRYLASEPDTEVCLVFILLAVVYMLVQIGKAVF